MDTSGGTKNVVITGCSSGFGLATAVAFATRGDRVVATMRNLARRDALDAALAEAGPDTSANVEVVALDVADDDSVRAAIAGIVEREGRVDVLVNNAGVGGTFGSIEDLSDQEWLDVLGTNVLGMVRTTRAVLPAMRAQRSGTVINVSSIAGTLPGAAMIAPYSASKHASCAFSDSLWSEVEHLGITVHCIEPGFFNTNIVANADVRDWGDSPYGGIAALVEEHFRTSVANGPGPRAVADAIVAAADGALGDSIHRPVGEDAELATTVLAQMTYNDFRAMQREMAGG